MKVTVELIYDGKPSRRLDVLVKNGLQGNRLLDAVDKAVKKAAEKDVEWRRWNLVNIEDE